MKTNASVLGEPAGFAPYEKLPLHQYEVRV